MTTCETCPRRCNLPEGALGYCRARRNVDGIVRPRNYGRLTSLALDPIEKKPIARWRPGSLVLSVGSYGCNLRCPFCQNWEISQATDGEVPWREVAPEELVGIALRERDRGARLAAQDPEAGWQMSGIAYTYNEPLVGWEYVRDCGRLAHEAGLANVLVSNGMASPAVIDELAPLLDAANIDLKSFSPDFYRWCGGSAGALGAVQSTIRSLANAPSCHLEVTTLVIGGLNDTDDEMRRISSWLASVSPQIVLHVTRFFPRWRLVDRPPTDVDRVYHLADVARENLQTVLVGNC